MAATSPSHRSPVMATNYDSFPITPAMLAMAWVKPPVLYYPGGTVTGSNTIYANATDDYRPRSDLEKAGAPGGPNGAVQPLPAPYPPLVQDPNYIIAATIEP